MYTVEVTWRPQDTAISCARLWGGLLILTGIIEIVVGAILFMGEKDVLNLNDGDFLQ